MKKRIGSALGLLFLLTLLTGCPESGCDQCNEAGGGANLESGANADPGAAPGGSLRAQRPVDDTGAFGDIEPEGRLLTGGSDVGVGVPGFGRSDRREL